MFRSALDRAIRMLKIRRRSFFAYCANEHWDGLELAIIVAHCVNYDLKVISLVESRKSLLEAEVSRLLQKHDAEINITVVSGKTPVHVARAMKNTTALLLLGEHLLEAQRFDLVHHAMDVGCRVIAQTCKTVKLMLDCQERGVIIDSTLTQEQFLREALGYIQIIPTLPPILPRPVRAVRRAAHTTATQLRQLTCLL